MLVSGRVYVPAVNSSGFFFCQPGCQGEARSLIYRAIREISPIHRLSDPFNLRSFLSVVNLVISSVKEIHISMFYRLEKRKMGLLGC